MDWSYTGFGFPGGRTFREYYRVFSVAMMAGRSDSRARELEKGGKVIMPPSALEKLSHLDIEWPVLFELSSDKTQRTTHAGVLEFVADEGRVYTPHWMMQNLGVEEGDFICIKNVSLPKGTFAKFEPQSVDFLDISNPRAVMENLLRGYACLTEGDIIALHYNDKVYELRVVETKPDRGISIIECDLNTDFAPPVGYVEPQRMPPPAAPSPADDASSVKSASSKKGFVPFAGTGQRLVNSTKQGTTRRRKKSTSNDTLEAPSQMHTVPSSASIQSLKSLNNMEEDDDDEDFVYVPGRLMFTRHHPKAIPAQRPGQKVDSQDTNGTEAPSKPTFEAFRGQGRRLA